MTSLPTSSKAAVLVGHDVPIEILDLHIPDLQPGQVLVELAFSGICHTQLGEVRGKRGEDRFIPHCLGHEGSGKVIAVGEEVTKVKSGDHVIVSWIAGEGLNVPGMTYQDGSGKTINAGGCNTLMTVSCVSENRVTPIPSDFPMDVAALIGCAVPTGAGAVFKKVQAQEGQSIAIFGAGGVGLSALLAAKASGCSPIIAVDIIDEKLNCMTEFGATHCVNAKTQDVKQEIDAITNGKGVDIAIEAAGVKSAMETAFNCTSLNAGKTVFLGNLPFGEKIEIDPFPLLLGRELMGTGGTCCNPDTDYPEFIRQNQEGKLEIEKLISHTFKLDQINEAFDLVESGESIRVMVDLRQE